MFEFTEPSLESAFRLDVDQVKITGQARTRREDRDVLVFEVRLVEPGCWCSVCGCAGRSRGSRSRLLTHCPNGTRPVKLLVRLRRYACADCGTYWSEQVPQSLAPPGAKLTVAAVNWALVAPVLMGSKLLGSTNIAGDMLGGGQTGSSP